MIRALERERMAFWDGGGPPQRSSKNEKGGRARHRFATSVIVNENDVHIIFIIPGAA